MAADVLATLGARTSAATILIELKKKYPAPPGYNGMNQQYQQLWR